MENISIKVHPPCYARGTPVNNTRDGPPMALSELSLFAIREVPSARGKPGECMNAIMGECLPVQQAGMNEEGRRNPIAIGSEDRRRSKTKGKTRPWLTLKTTFLNAQKSVYSQWCALLGRKWDVVFVDADLSACVAPDNVNFINDNVKIELNESLFDSFGTIDAVRSSEEDVDMSAFEEPDTVIMRSKAGIDSVQQ